MSWSKIFLPMWNAFISICNDESGPSQITKNNVVLSELAKQQDVPINLESFIQLAKQQDNDKD